jgi:hypothetical protein
MPVGQDGILRGVGNPAVPAAGTVHAKRRYCPAFGTTTILVNEASMTSEEMQRSIEAHDRQIGALVSLLAGLSGRLDQLVRLAEIQNARLERLEGGK